MFPWLHGELLTCTFLLHQVVYLEIIALFSLFTCVVYVKGLNRIDDCLLKWLAEYTLAHPWRFVYLENVDLSWNYSENRDRCVFLGNLDSHRARRLGELTSSHSRKFRPVHEVNNHSDTLPSSAQWSNITKMVAEFCRDKYKYDPHMQAEESADQQRIRDWFSATPASCPSSLSDPYSTTIVTRMRCFPVTVTLLVSPPGAGKTEFVTKSLEKEVGMALKYFDGSSDILVKTALEDALNRRINLTKRTGRKLLVVDEYHMLSESHKRDLFYWLRGKLVNLHVLLIANRHDRNDEELLRGCSVEVDGGQFGADTAVSKPLQVRLDKAKIIEVAEIRQCRHKENIARWLLCSRLIFGEESISLRAILPLESILNKYHRDDFRECRAALAEYLAGKVPTISHRTALEFADAYCARLRDPASAPIATLCGVLVSYAWLDWEDRAYSYPAMMKELPRNFRYPPAVRLAFWCSYIHCCFQHTEGLRTAATDLGPLFQSQLVDQVGFPFQLEEPCTESQLSRGYAFSWEGDCSSLTALRDAVQRGHSIDWQVVAKQEWEPHGIADVNGLGLLLSTVADAEKCLRHIPKDKLGGLLNGSQGKEVVTLAKFVMKYGELLLPQVDDMVTAFAAVRKDDNLFFRAFWTRLRHDPNLSTSEDFCKAMRDSVFNQTYQLDGPLLLLEALKWVKTCSMSYKIVSGDVRERTAVLQRLLVTVTEYIFTARQNTIQIDYQSVWTGFYAPLFEYVHSLRVEAGAAEGVMMSNNHVRRVLLSIRGGSDANWPIYIKQLYNVLKAKAQASDIDDLWGNPELRPLLLDWDDKTDNMQTACIDEAVVAGILRIKSGTLNLEVQKQLLLRPCIFPAQVQEPRAYMFMDAVSEIPNRDDLMLVRSMWMRAEIKVLSERSTNLGTNAWLSCPTATQDSRIPVRHTVQQMGSAQSIQVTSLFDQEYGQCDDQ